MKYSQALIDGEYESSYIASQKELRSISVLITLHGYTHLSATKSYCGPHCR